MPRPQGERCRGAAGNDPSRPRGDEHRVCPLCLSSRGALSDRIGKLRLLAAGASLLALADLVFILTSGVPLLLVGVGIWGRHLGLTQSLLAALVADAAPEALRGTAFGAFNIARGLALIVGSTAAGALWRPSADLLRRRRLCGLGRGRLHRLGQNDRLNGRSFLCGRRHRP
ncbi:MAG: MFS transporter [Rhodomicrobium sp.]